METIKEEKKADLEQLLNSLIEKRGRVPFGDEKIHSFGIIYVTGKVWNIIAKRGRGQVNKHYSIIELCSKSSGLWQFVCENKLYKDYNEDSGTYWDSTMKIYNYRDYQYWIIESSLKDESELEDLLLSNIKVDAND